MAGAAFAGRCSARWFLLARGIRSNEFQGRAANWFRSRCNPERTNQQLAVVFTRWNWGQSWKAVASIRWSNHWRLGATVAPCSRDSLASLLATTLGQCVLRCARLPEEPRETWAFVL